LGPSWLLTFDFRINIKDLHAVWICLKWKASILAYALIVIEYPDVPTPRQTSWLNDPEILSSINICLTKVFGQFFQKRFAKIINVFPVGMGSLFLCWKTFILLKVLAHIFEHFFVPFFSEDKLYVAFWVKASQDKSMFGLCQVKPTINLIVFLLYNLVNLFSC